MFNLLLLYILNCNGACTRVITFPKIVYIDIIENVNELQNLFLINTLYRISSAVYRPQYNGNDNLRCVQNVYTTSNFYM